MVFIRSKKIKGNTYYYLVRSVREGSRVKQITLDYLGTEKPSTDEFVRLKKRYDH